MKRKVSTAVLFAALLPAAVWASPVTSWVSAFDPQNNNPRFVGSTATTASPVTTDADQDAIAANFSSVTLADGEFITLTGSVTVDVGLANEQFRIGLFNGAAVAEDTANPYVGIISEAGTSGATDLGWGPGTHASHMFGSTVSLDSGFLPAGGSVAADTPIAFSLTIARDGDLLDVSSSFTATGYSTSGTAFGVDVTGQTGFTDYTFNTVSFLLGGELNGNQASFSNIAVSTGVSDPSPDDLISHIRIFLQGGQSNADGRADATGQPSYEDVDFFYKIQGGGSGTLGTLFAGAAENGYFFGPELSFGRRMTDLLGGATSTSRVCVLKYANGGTNLHTDWMAGGDNTSAGDGTEYLAFQSGVTTGIAALEAKYINATVSIEGMVWMQGEADTETLAYANAYHANLTNFIADVRSTYGAELPFVIGRLSTNQTETVQPGWASFDPDNMPVVQAAQDLAAGNDARTGIVNTDTFTLKPESNGFIHFDASGQLDLGNGFALETAFILQVIDRPDGPLVLGVDFNRNDALGSPSQSFFRIVSGSTTQGDNSASYVKTIGTTVVSISQPGSVALEFRGANTDSSRAIPGGDVSISFLVSDFIATREGMLEISISNLPAGDYVFRSYHLDTITGGDLGFAQGSSATTPNTIEARIGGILKGSAQPTALGSAGLNTTFINNSQVPALLFSISHDGLGPLVIELSTTDTNGGNSYLLLNGFELLEAAP